MHHNDKKQQYCKNTYRIIPPADKKGVSMCSLTQNTAWNETVMKHKDPLTASAAPLLVQK
jgi:hypothetical protein